MLGFKVSKEVAEMLFDTFDDDRSGEISYEELRGKLRAALIKNAGIELDDALKAGAMGDIELQAKNKFALRKGPTEGISGVLGSQTKLLTGPDAPPVVEQIRDALSANLTRVIDLFREWDDDGNGNVSKREFRLALPMLGLQISKVDADALFDSIDKDGSGTVEYAELAKQLKPKVKVTMKKSRSAPRLLPSPTRSGAEEYKDALAAEQVAKRRLARIQKELMRAASTSALHEEKERKRLEGMALRRDMDERVGRDLSQALQSVSAAREEEVKALAVLFRTKMEAVLPDPSWFKLFRWMDEDRNGTIQYLELRSMVRRVLSVPRTELSEAKLKSLWKALDEDASGYLSAGEFGRFFKKGYEKGEGSALTAVRSRMQAVSEKRAAESAAQKAEQERRVGLSLAKQLAGIEKATKEEVVALAEQLTTKLTALFPGSHRGWIKLFKSMDDDGNGRITFEEMQIMVRQKLQLDKSELPEGKLRAVWKAIDADASGFLSVGEFGRFMKKGATLLAQQAVAQETEDETARRRRVAKQEREAKKLAAEVAEDTRLREASREHAALTRRLEEDARRLEEALRKKRFKGTDVRGTLPPIGGMRKGAQGEKKESSPLPQGSRPPQAQRPVRVTQMYGVDF
jgi:Ca2+-binding EF-hand superfamily protein